MRIVLIYATWPVTPFGATWYKLADSLRAAGLSEALRDAGHTVDEHILAADGPGAAELRGGFELAGAIAMRCREAQAAGALPVIICGSCGVAAAGAVAGLGGDNTGIVWMDAHPDLNTPETSGSGMFDGMALAVALGMCWKQMAGTLAGLHPASAAKVCLYGARDIDPGEAAFIAANGIPTVSGGGEAVRHLAGCAGVYIHLDMDVHDALAVRANGFAVPGGPAPRDVRRTLVEIARSLPVAALSITGLDPAAPDAALAMATAVEHIRAVCDGVGSPLTICGP